MTSHATEQSTIIDITAERAVGAAAAIVAVPSEAPAVDTLSQATLSQAAFHEVLLACLPRLRIQARALARDRAAADDLVQEAVAKALAARTQFAAGTDFPAWMHRILRNTFLSDMRRRRPTISVEDAPAEVFARSGGAEEGLVMRELAAALARLPAEQREALVLLTVEGMSCEEIAAMSGCAPGTVKARVFRARRALQTMLLGDGAGAGAGVTEAGFGRDRRAARKPAARPAAAARRSASGATAGAADAAANSFSPRPDAINSARAESATVPDAGFPTPRLCGSDQPAFP